MFRRIELNVCFLSENPKVGKDRSEIKMELVSFPYGSHIIFYRIFKNHIRIVRVLYGGRDLVKFLK
ncbi:type II toxin-antitoxin system RelE/ParE family toxin [Aquimarina agarilytica]|uniref:type II toxin-antitoxin system RelE/ParE family toxin n=1 Tax=Aquimarina agarilytica TaxID=1087449 RepID=UPI002934747C|nr:type II toxin-antitoxin system RelE/ParE family toxin [Aquimarina agarilytica]